MRETSTARFYELMVITAPDGTPEELVETVEQITGYISDAGGSIIRTNYDSPWGRRRLSYPIRHHSQDVRDGFYSLIHLQMNPDRVIDVEREMKLNDRLMRYLVLQLSGEPVFPEPEVEGEEGEVASEGGESTAAPNAQAAPETPAAVEAPAATEAPAAEAEQSSEATAEDRRSLASTETDTDPAPAEESTSESDTTETEAEAEITPVAEEAKEEPDVSE